MSERPQPELFSGAGSEVDEPSPDVSIELSASARELRAPEEPQRARLSAGGEPGLRRHDESRRERLPERVEPGQVYRDVRVRRLLAVRVVDEEA